jgi:catechol 2,3-dioxygenase-like lactoylglutathione lyase family enzyme
MNAPSYEVQMLKIPVSDIEVSSQFYATHLGFEIQFAAAEYGWAQLSAAGLALALYKPGMGGGDGQLGGSVDFHLSLPDKAFQSLATSLLEEGHLVEDRIHTGNDGSTFMDICDPDGNVIKIMKR